MASMPLSQLAAQLCSLLFGRGPWLPGVRHLYLSSAQNDRGDPASLSSVMARGIASSSATLSLS